MSAHIVKWQTPLGSYVSPYVNRFPLVRRLMYARFAAAIRHAGNLQHARVLDFGCWDGYFLPSLMMNYAEVWGVDDDSGSMLEAVPDYWSILQIARSLCQSELGGDANLALVKATGSSLPFPDGYFDVVFCLDTLAHVALPLKRAVVKELGRITNGQGKLVFALPLESGPALVLRRLLRRLSRKHPCHYVYDPRADLRLLESEFHLQRKEFHPLPFLGALNSTVIADCRPRA